MWNGLQIVIQCGVKEETIKHVLILWTARLQFAKILWEQAKGITGVKLPSLHPTTWARDLLFIGTARERSVIICGMWSLWMLRIRRRHGEAELPIRHAVMWVRDPITCLISGGYYIQSSKLLRRNTSPDGLGLTRAG
ncbi:hypothetical protein HU200_029063 [Digitaria exilis]|uniref:Uncharacterized protein n=1 Tax=Digitaria exilis TaxID=1010633 RepID=A0A835BUQ0_9POAL|nr:hypothetical protein HU200_029063 [Digitaria exilis]